MILHFIFLLILYIYNQKKYIIDIINFIFRLFKNPLINNLPKYKITLKDFDINKKTIIYFSGLLPSSFDKFTEISNQFDNFNNIIIEINPENNDIFENILIMIKTELENKFKLKFDNIECIIGYSFGGSLALQYKNLFTENNEYKYIKTILISPGGFENNNLVENIIKLTIKNIYLFNKNNICYILYNYPKYQNTFDIDDKDYMIVSSADFIHYPKIKSNENIINLEHVSHYNILSIIIKQNIISQLIQNNYNLNKIVIKKLSSKFNRFIFGGHFFPYNLSLWLSVSLRNLYLCVKFGITFKNTLYGFLLASIIWSLSEYLFHGIFLHKLFYKFHEKHHIYPTKISTITNPMILVIITWIFYYNLLKIFVNTQILYVYGIFFPLYYLLIEFAHLYSHKYNGNNYIIQNIKEYHKLHHSNKQNENFCFTSPFWDYLFGSMNESYTITFIELLFGFIPLYSFTIRYFVNNKIIRKNIFCNKD